MKQLTIKNCTLVNEGSLLERDVLIKNGRIEKIEASIDEEGDFIDAKGLHLLPGFIDDQVHFREPGLTERGNIQTESIAAVAGGTTSFMDMPNVIPPTLNLELWNEKINMSYQNKDSNGSMREIIHMCKLNNYKMDISIKLENNKNINFKLE